MIEVKENLTNEQIKQFSETKSFGALDYLKGGLKKGAKNIASKALGHEFQGAVMYAKSNFDLGDAKVTVTIGAKKGKKSKSLGEANDSLKEIAKNMKDESRNLSADDEGKATRTLPIRIITAIDVENIDKEVNKELSAFINSNDFESIGIIKGKGV